jgi:hypothetical protein
MKNILFLIVTYLGKFGAWGHASLYHGTNTYGHSYGTSSHV